MQKIRHKAKATSRDVDREHFEQVRSRIIFQDQDMEGSSLLTYTLIDHIWYRTSVADSDPVDPYGR